MRSSERLGRLAAQGVAGGDEMLARLGRLLDGLKEPGLADLTGEGLERWHRPLVEMPPVAGRVNAGRQQDALDSLQVFHVISHGR